MSYKSRFLSTPVILTDEQFQALNGLRKLFYKKLDAGTSIPFDYNRDNQNFAVKTNSKGQIVPPNHVTLHGTVGTGKTSQSGSKSVRLHNGSYIEDDNQNNSNNLLDGILLAEILTGDLNDNNPQPIINTDSNTDPNQFQGFGGGDFSGAGSSGSFAPDPQPIQPDTNYNVPDTSYTQPDPEPYSAPDNSYTDNINSDSSSSNSFDN